MPPNGRSLWFWNPFRVAQNDTSTTTDPSQSGDVPRDRILSVSEEEARSGVELLQHFIGRKGYYKGRLEELELTFENAMTEHERVVRKLRVEHENLRAEHAKLRRVVVGQEKKLWRMGQFKVIIEDGMAGLAREMAENDECSQEEDEQDAGDI